MTIFLLILKNIKFNIFFSKSLKINNFTLTSSFKTLKNNIYTFKPRFFIFFQLLLSPKIFKNNNFTHILQLQLLTSPSISSFFWLNRKRWYDKKMKISLSHYCATKRCLFIASCDKEAPRGRNLFVTPP